MKKRFGSKGIVLLMIAVFFLSSTVLFAGGKQEKDAGEEDGVVTITVTSWRSEDVKGMEAIHALFEQEYPGIKVRFEPIKNTEYYAQVGTAMETGTNNYDVITLHGYGAGKAIYDSGYVVPLNDLVPELSKVDSQSKEPWADGDVVYGVPWVAVSHGFYYNKAIFDKYNLKEPEVWSDFMGILDTLKSNGETPLAAGSKDPWTLNAMGYCNYGANFYGGEESRQKLMAGEMKVTDRPFVRAFEVMDSLTPYYPTGYQALDYVSTQQMFVTGQAVIFPGGSWEIAPFQNMGADFEIGWFAPPVENKGDTLQYGWAAGSGLAMFADTPHKDEVLTYLGWMLSHQASQITMEAIPGFYVYLQGDYELSSDLALEMLEAKKGAVLTERLTYEKLSAQEPSGTALFYEAEQKLANKQLTPKEAAEYVQNGLEGWFDFK